MIHKDSEKTAIAGNILNKHVILFILLVILIASAILRFYQIDLNGMWVDESNTVIISEKNPVEIIKALKHDASPPLFYGMLHFWMLLFGQSETAIRALSAFFGIILTGFLYVTGTELFNRKTGLFAAIFCSVSPLQIMYSQQARMYTLLPLAGLLSMHFFIKFSKTNNRKDLILYLLFSICTVFTHHYGFLLIPVQFILVMFLGNKKIKTALLGAIIFGAIIKYKLWMPKIIGLFKPEKADVESWMAFFWEQYGFFGSQLKSFESFTPGGQTPPYVAMNSMAWQPLLPVIVCILLLGLSLTPLILYKKHTKNERESIIWMLLYGFLPLFAAAVYSLLFKPVYLAGRCDQIVFPAFCLIFGSGIYHLRNGYAQYLSIGIIITCSFFTLNTYYTTDAMPGDRLIAKTVIDNIKPGDSIICTSLTRASLQYYLRDKKNEVTLYSFPLENEKHLAWHKPDRYLVKPQILSQDAESIENKISNVKNGNGRLMIIYEDHPINKYLINYFADKITPSTLKASGWFRQSVMNTPAKILMMELKQ